MREEDVPPDDGNRYFDRIGTPVSIWDMKYLHIHRGGQIAFSLDGSSRYLYYGKKENPWCLETTEELGIPKNSSFVHILNIVTILECSGLNFFSRSDGKPIDAEKVMKQIALAVMSSLSFVVKKSDELPPGSRIQGYREERSVEIQYRKPNSCCGISRLLVAPWVASDWNEKTWRLWINHVLEVLELCRVRIKVEHFNRFVFSAIVDK